VFESYTDPAIDMYLEDRLEEPEDLENYVNNVWPGNKVSQQSFRVLREFLIDFLRNPPIDSNDRYHRFEKPLLKCIL
jgi:hypothetical protein